MEFSTATVLTIVTGFAFERGLAKAKGLIEHMTGEPASELTFLAGVIPEICKEEILRQYPGLLITTRWKIDATDYDLYLELVTDEVGESLIIQPIQNMPSPEDYIELQ